MGDTISRRAAIDALNKEIIKRRLLDDVNDGMLDEFDTEDILRKLPSAEPQRMKGKWILKPDEKFHCDKCDGIAPKGFRWDFCPNCGADMRGESDG